MKIIIIIISIIILLFSFQAPAMAQEEYTINHQIEILTLKLEIVRLKKGIWLEKIKQAVYFHELRLEESRLAGEINNLTMVKKKQEAEIKAEEGRE